MSLAAGVSHQDTAKKVVEISARVERLPLCWFHYKMLIIHGFGWAFDAFDVGIVTFIVTALAKDWNLTSGQIGVILSAGLAGMLVGAIISGYVADIFGRKKIFQSTLLIFCVFSLLCAFAQNYTTMVIFRFFVGIGLGGETPVVSSLFGEFIPAKHRGKIQGQLNTFWAIGWLGAAVISYFVIPSYGWRWAFIAGAMPALFIWIIRIWLPESPRWAANRGLLDEAEKLTLQIEEEVRSIIRQELPPVGKIDRLPNAEKISVGILFSPKYIKRTIMLWVLWFFGMFGYYGLFSWLPTLLVKSGYSMVKSFSYLVFMQIAYVPNQVLSAFLMDKVGRKWLLVTNLILSACSAIAYGMVLSSKPGPGVIILVGIITSWFVSGVWGITYTYTPELFPTRIRATGTGSASACSRVGSMLAPIVVGYSLAAVGVQGVFTIVGAAFALAALFVAIMGVETRQKVLDEV